MGKVDDLFAAVKAKRLQEAAAKGGDKHGLTPTDKDGPKPKRKPGPARKSPLGLWIRRETWATIGTTCQAIYSTMCHMMDFKTRYYSHGYGPLAKRCGVSTDTVGRSIETLQVHGLVRTKTVTAPCKGQARTRVYIWALEPGDPLVILDRTDAALSGMGPAPQPCPPVEKPPAENATGGQPCGPVD